MRKTRIRALIVDDNHSIHVDLKKVLATAEEVNPKLLELEAEVFGPSSQEEAGPADVATPVFEIDSAFQGQQGLEMVSQAVGAGDPYSVLFMDVRMPPGWDGIQTTREIWKRFPDTEIIVCTAFSDYSIEAILRELGISDRLLFLRKPLDPDVTKQAAITMATKAQIRNELIRSSRIAALGEMTANIAHEINNPLAVASGYVERIQDLLQMASPEVSKALEAAAKANNAIQRVARIIRAVKGISRNASADPREEVNLPEVISGVRELCSERMRKNGVQFGVSEVPPISLQSRATEISQVLLNLINNSVDALAELPEKSIRLEMTADERFVAFIVTDSGPGIPPALRSRLFRPFFTTKEAGKGTGLGLSISRGIAERLGGTLELDASVPHTRFVFRIPLTSPLIDERQDACVPEHSPGG